MVAPTHADEFPPAARYLILAAAFLGWMFSGFQMAVMTLTAPSATTEFQRTGQVSADAVFRVERLLTVPALPGQQPQVASDNPSERKGYGSLWFSWYNAAFLFGAAAGGLVFGWMGDRLGRVDKFRFSHGGRASQRAGPPPPDRPAGSGRPTRRPESRSAARESRTGDWPP